MLNAHGIDRALAVHNRAALYDHMDGNRAMGSLAHESRGRVCAQWVAAPHIDGRFPKPAALMDEMRAASVRSLRIIPSRLCTRFHPFDYGDLMEACEARRVPLFYDSDPVAPFCHQLDWEGVEASLERFPDSPVVLVNTGYRILSQLVRMMRRFPSLHVESCLLQADKLIEMLCERVGADRILFGTRLRVYAPGAAKHKIETARVSEVQRAAMAGGNLIRLLEAAQP